MVVPLGRLLCQESWDRARAPKTLAPGPSASQAKAAFTMRCLPTRLGGGSHGALMSFRLAAAA